MDDEPDVLDDEADEPVEFGIPDTVEPTEAELQRLAAEQAEALLREGDEPPGLLGPHGDDMEQVKALADYLEGQSLAWQAEQAAIQAVFDAEEQAALDGREEREPIDFSHWSSEDILSLANGVTGEGPMSRPFAPVSDEEFERAMALMGI